MILYGLRNKVTRVYLGWDRKSVPRLWKLPGGWKNTPQWKSGDWEVVPMELTPLTASRVSE